MICAILVDEVINNSFTFRFGHRIPIPETHMTDATALLKLI